MSDKHKIRCSVCKSEQQKEIDNLIKNEVPHNMSLEEVGMKYGLTYKTILSHSKYIQEQTPKEEVEETGVVDETKVDSEKFLEGMLRQGEGAKVTGNALISAAKELANIRKNKDANLEEKELVLNALKGFEGFSEEHLDKYIARVECLIETLKNSESTQTK